MKNIIERIFTKGFPSTIVGAAIVAATHLYSFSPEVNEVLYIVAGMLGWHKPSENTPQI